MTPGQNVLMVGAMLGFVAAVGAVTTGQIIPGWF